MLGVGNVPHTVRERLVLRFGRFLDGQLVGLSPAAGTLTAAVNIEIPSSRLRRCAGNQAGFLQCQPIGEAHDLVGLKKLVVCPVIIDLVRIGQAHIAIPQDNGVLGPDGEVLSYAGRLFTGLLVLFKIYLE